MNQFIQEVIRLEKQYQTAIAIGFIAGVGVTLMIVSLLFIQYVRETQIRVFSIRASKEREIIELAQNTCFSGKVGLIRWNEWEFQVVCG